MALKKPYKLSRRTFLKGFCLVITSAYTLPLLSACTRKDELEPVVATTTKTTTTVPPEPVDPWETKRIAKIKEDYFEGTFETFENGFINPATIVPITISADKLTDVTVLINKYYEMEKGWVPDDLESIKTNFDRASKLRHEAALAWYELDAAAKEAGLTFYARDGWRSESLQNTYYTNAYNRNPANAARFNALPWRSEHQLGIALDVTDVTTTEDSLRQDFEFTEHGQFLVNEGWKYGWIVRYMTKDEMITQYNNEPWHIRYVGKELAKILIENDLTLEEYYGEVYI